MRNGHNLKATIQGLEKRMREAAGNLEFEEAARLHDEIRRLESIELAVSDDPLARPEAVDEKEDRYTKKGRDGGSGGDRVEIRRPARGGRSTGGQPGTRTTRKGQRVDI